MMRAAFAHWSGPALSAALIGVAVLLILIALYIKSPLLKAGVLAYEVFP